MSYASTVLALSPLAYWKFDEGRAIAANAGSGAVWAYGTGVTAQKTALTSDGGYSVAGSGSSYIADSMTLPSGTSGGTVSVEAWVKIPAGNVSGPIVNVGGTDFVGWGVGVGGTTWDNTGKQLILLNAGNAWVPTGVTLSTGTHHIVVTRSSGNSFITYVDGSSVYTTSFTPNAATGYIRVGGSPTRSLSSTVDVDNAAIFASVLSSGRVTAHYASGAGDNAAVLADSPVAFLKFDEASATGTSGSTFADSSGNGRTLTNFGPPSIEQPSLLGDGTGWSVAYGGSGQLSAISSASWMNTTTTAGVVRLKADSAAVTGSQYIASRWGGSGALAWLAYLDSGKLHLSVWAGGAQRDVIGSTTLTAGNTYTLGWEYDGSALKVYVNGTQDGSTTFSGTLPSVTADLEVARAAAAVYGNVKLDELAIFSSLGGTNHATLHSAAIASASSSPATVAVPVAALAFAAPAPTVTAGSAASVAIPVAALTLSAPAPVVSIGTSASVAVPVASLTLAAPAPTVSFGVSATVAVPVASLTLAAPAPTVTAGVSATVAVPVAALTLTAPAPTVSTASDAAIVLDVGVDLLVLSQESQSPIVESDGAILLDTTVDLIVRHQLTPASVPAPWSSCPISRTAHRMPALSAAVPRRREGADGYTVDRVYDVGRFEVFVDGRPVTYLRDQPARFSDVTNTVQVGPLSATVGLPQMRPWDVPGEGDLSMFDPDNDARVEVVFVREDGSVDYRFEGALARDEDSSGSGREEYTFNAEGALLQAAHEPFDPPILQPATEPGWLVADVLNSVTHRRYGKIPRFTTGLPKVTDRGSQGQSKWQRAQDLLSKCIDDDGRQVRLVRVGPWEYRLAWKRSMGTAQWTVTKGAPGVEVSLQVDQSTRRDCIYGRGVDPEGGVWGNYFFPGLDFYLPPRYPMNNTSINLDGLSDGDTDTGNGITLWQRRMREVGFRVRVDGVMNSADVKWVRQVQRARGITVDGSLGPQTWAATFDKGATELDFEVVRRPLATVPTVEPWLYAANGARAGKNLADNPKRIRHAMPEVDFGNDIYKRDAAELARKMLVRDSVPAHVGSITLTSDPWEDGASRFDIEPGDNVKVVGHRGDVIVQVAEVSHDDVTVTLTVDSKARDMMALEAILSRDPDPRRNPSARSGATTDMSSLNKSEVVQYESESRAGVYPRTAINGDSGLWTVLPIFVSQVGVAKVEFQALHPRAELIVALFEKPITANRLAAYAADPLSNTDGWYDNVDELEAKHGLMEVFGTPGSPGGYWPRQKGDGPLTGRMRDRSGALYSSKYGGYVWVAVFASRSTWVEGRVFPASGR